MMPAGPIMTEHRLIERMIPLMQAQLTLMDSPAKVDLNFLNAAVDFFRTYTDRCHHCKEEDILFRALAEKPLCEELRQTMNKLVQDHVFARGLVGQLLIDKDRHCQGVQTAWQDLKKSMQTLAMFYPIHIETEDKHFLLPCMAYLNENEQKYMLQRFAEFDRKLIHEKYKLLIEDLSRGACVSE